MIIAHDVAEGFHPATLVLREGVGLKRIEGLEGLG